MAKRKRELEPQNSSTTKNDDAATKVTKMNGHVDVKTPGPVIQIVAGSYERVLHGITASTADLTSSTPSVQFADSFLFQAHTSSIRCLAISPPSDGEGTEDQGVYLATGGSDERINVYSLSASPILESDKVPAMPTLGGHEISENPGNRELGTLLQHSSNVTALHFPTRAKLLSGSEDNTISISRVRDLTVVSTIKAPRPKAVGQPSGDTAPVGATPAGVNDFAIHPSMKLMISVGRGEKCMRLWNLVTGRKAGVLNFDRHVLTAIKESKYSSGEGRKIRWNPAGTEFAISFERGVIVFGDDSKTKFTILPEPMTKVHQIAYMMVNEDKSLLALSTEDGRILFYDTSVQTTDSSEPVKGARAVAQLGGRTAGISGRIKDFKLLQIKGEGINITGYIVVTASSDGSIKTWYIKASEVNLETNKDKVVQIGNLIGTYETGNRVTCLDAFVMRSASDGFGGLSEFEGLTEAEDESESDSDSD